MDVVLAKTASQWGHARELVEQYVASLNADLGFQDYQSEIADLPAQYGPSSGCWFLATVDDRYVGCVGVRRLDEGLCEMKRLYVRPEHLGQGIGRALAEAVIAEARTLGYARMRLDTWPSMKVARALYERMGFKEIPAYRYNPDKPTSFMELAL